MPMPMDGKTLIRMRRKNLRRCFAVEYTKCIGLATFYWKYVDHVGFWFLESSSRLFDAWFNIVLYFDVRESQF